MGTDRAKIVLLSRVRAVFVFLGLLQREQLVDAVSTTAIARPVIVALGLDPVLSCSTTSLHEVIRLVLQPLLTLVDVDDPREVEEVSDQVGLDSVVKGRITRERRREIDLEQPRVQLIIDHHVEPEQLKAVVPMRHMHLESVKKDRLAGNNGLDDDVLDPTEEAFVVDEMLSEHLA